MALESGPTPLATRPRHPSIGEALLRPGLSVFIQDRPVAQRGLPLTWPKLSLGAGMGSDIVAAVNALQRCFKMNINYSPDLSHGVYNDVWGAGKDANLSSYLYMLL